VVRFALYLFYGKRRLRLWLHDPLRFPGFPLETAFANAMMMGLALFYSTPSFAAKSSLVPGFNPALSSTYELCENQL